VRNEIPRFAGEEAVRLRMTKIASGYWHVADSQAGFTAIALPMLRNLDLHAI
jgi:hypothetical protein